MNIDQQRTKFSSIHIRGTCACVRMLVHNISQSAILQGTDASRVISGAKWCQEINFRPVQKYVFRMTTSEVEPWVSHSQCSPPPPRKMVKYVKLHTVLLLLYKVILWPGRSKMIKLVSMVCFIRHITRLIHCRKRRFKSGSVIFRVE